MEYTNKDCELYGKNICSYVGSEGCETCFLKDFDGKKSSRNSAYEAWQITLGNIPAEVDELHTSKKCQFCIDEPKDAECYGIIDMGHPEPEHRKGMFFGFGKKIRSEMGSMVSFPVACCKDCRRRYHTKDVLRIGVWVGM